MGTNFYWSPDSEGPHCDTCTCHEALHIGKRSGGWKFALRIHPYLDICELEDWKEKFNQAGSSIYNEYGSKVEVSEMLDIIEHWGDEAPQTRDYKYLDTKPGLGNYDLLDIEFS